MQYRKFFLNPLFILNMPLLVIFLLRLEGARVKYDILGQLPIKHLEMAQK